MRVRFPDGYILEANFLPSERIHSLVDLLMKVLARPDLPFYLCKFCFSLRGHRCRVYLCFSCPLSPFVVPLYFTIAIMYSGCELLQFVDYTYIYYSWQPSMLAIIVWGNS